MSAFSALQDRLGGNSGALPLKVLAASGQLGYGIPEESFRAGLKRQPDFIGCDMGSIDPGPYYLGSGQLATSEAVTLRDLRLVLTGALSLKVPLQIGTAGTAGAAPHLETTLQMVRRIANEEGLHFRLAIIEADMPRAVVKAAVRADRVRSLGTMPALTESEVDAASHLVGQMGTEAFQRALAMEPDVVIAGRACDTAIFAAIPALLGYPMGALMHMAKIIECTSICCVPGGRDAMLATLEGESFLLESMDPKRHATPMSVAAHSLYEQSDPNVVIEPEGTVYLDSAEYFVVDEHRTRVRGARWVQASQPSIKLEGATRVGERAVLVAGSSDPRFIASIESIVPEVEAIVREVVPPSTERPYQMFFRVYGVNGVLAWTQPPAVPPREVFILVECIAETIEEAKTVVSVCKQFLLHHGFEGRLSTGGNIAFPFTPPELIASPAYRFNVYHVMETDDLAELFPVRVENV